MHDFCIKFSKIFWGRGIAPSPDPTPILSPPILNFCIRHWPYSLSLFHSPNAWTKMGVSICEVYAKSHQ